MGPLEPRRGESTANKQYLPVERMLNEVLLIRAMETDQKGAFDAKLKRWQRRESTDRAVAMKFWTVAGEVWSR